MSLSANLEIALKRRAIFFIKNLSSNVVHYLKKNISFFYFFVERINKTIFLLFTFLILNSTLFSITVAITDVDFKLYSSKDPFFNSLSDSLLFEFSELDSINLIKVNLLNNEIEDNIRKLINLKEFNGVDYCVSWVIDKVVMKTEPNFYDNEIIENVFIVEGSFFLYSINENLLIDSKRFYVNKISRDDFSLLKDHGLKEISVVFRKFIMQLEVKNTFIEIKENNKLFLNLNFGKLDGIKNGDYLRSVNGSLVKIISAKDKTSFGYVIIPSKTENTRYYKNKKSDFEFRVDIGATFLLGNSNLITPAPDLSLSLNIPVIQFFKPFVDVSFVFTTKNDNLLVPIMASTGLEGYFDILFISLYHRIGVGALFSPDSDGILISDSFLFNTSFGGSVRITPEIKIFINCGYRYIVREQFLENWGLSLSTFSVRGGIGIVF